MNRNIYFTLATGKGKTSPGIRPNKDKMSRFQQIALPLFKAGKIWFPEELKDSIELKEMMNELSLATFKGFKSKHDDQIDNISVEIDNEDKVNRKNDNDIVSDVIKGWSESWQSKNLEEYFSYYQEDFTPNTFNNNELWIKDRSRKILGKSAIEIDIKDLSIIFDINEGERAIAEFIQYYKSESYTDTVTKKVILKKFGSQWKIVSEDIAR